MSNMENGDFEANVQATEVDGVAAESETSGDIESKSGSGIQSPVHKFEASGDADFVAGANLVAGSGGGSPRKDQDVVCDDCGKQEPIRIWRWCKGCERVLCETCCVEAHLEHLIESYATAVRVSDDQFRQTVDQARTGVEQLTSSAKDAVELKNEIVAKLDAVKREMRGKFDESKDIEDTLKQHVAAIEKFFEKPLTAKTWMERNHLMEGLEKLLKTSVEKQDELEGYLKLVDEQVDESSGKLGQVFREDH